MTRTAISLLIDLNMAMVAAVEVLGETGSLGSQASGTLM